MRNRRVNGDGVNGRDGQKGASPKGFEVEVDAAGGLVHFAGAAGPEIAVAMVRKRLLMELSPTKGVSWSIRSRATFLQSGPFARSGERSSRSASCLAQEE